MPEIKQPELTEQEKIHKSLFAEWFRAGQKLTYGRWLEAKLAEAKRDTARLDMLLMKGSVRIWSKRANAWVDISHRSDIDAAMLEHPDA